MRTPALKTLTLSVIGAMALAACGGGTEQSASASSVVTPRLMASTSANVQAFFGLRSNYVITKTPNGYSVRDKTSGTTTNVPANVTAIRFSDLSVNLQMGDIAASISAASLKTLVELYIAFFNRLPDADGLAYWINQFKGGMSVEQIGAQFYNAAISPDYSALTGYSANMTNEQFITVIYKNVLGRNEVDAGGMSFWTDQLSSGKATRGSLVRDILSGAHSYKGDATYGAVADLLDNKATVGQKFAVTHALTFNDPFIGYQQGISLAATVTSTSTSAADTLIGNMSSGSGAVEGGGGTNSGGTGVGNYADCINTDLYKTGTVYSMQMRENSDGVMVDATATYTVTGPATFKGNNTIEIKVDGTVNTSEGPQSTSLKTYGNLDANFSYAYGAVMTNTIPGYGSFTMTMWNVPAVKLPLNLAPNAPYSQTVTTKQESSSPILPAQPDSTETMTTTFLGIENVTVPAGTFSACKIKTDTTIAGKTSTSYSWAIASGTYRGLTAKTADETNATMEAVKFTLNGK